jgi:hypothetical protein
MRWHNTTFRRRVRSPMLGEAMCPWSTLSIRGRTGQEPARQRTTWHTRPGPMAGTPTEEATGQGATLSGDMARRKTVEAETHQRRRNRAVSYGGRSPPPAPATTIFDDLEPLGVDDGPMVGHMRGPWLPRCVRHRRTKPRAEALEHRDPCRRLWTKVTLRGHSCSG